MIQAAPLAAEKPALGLSVQPPGVDTGVVPLAQLCAETVVRLDLQALMNGVL